MQNRRLDACNRVWRPSIHSDCGRTHPDSLRGLQGITNFFEIAEIRARSHFLQYLITALVALQLGDAAVGIHQVAKYDCLCRAGLLACGLDVTILHLPASLERGVLGQLDSLDTQAALFHDAARAYG